MSMKLVKQLRQATGARLVDCKAAVEATAGLEEAFQWLREKGASRAAKLETRTAAHGLVAARAADGRGCLVEVNSEFQHPDDVRAALRELDGRELHGARVRVVEDRGGGSYRGGRDGGPRPGPDRYGGGGDSYRDDYRGSYRDDYRGGGGGYDRGGGGYSDDYRGGGGGGYDRDGPRGGGGYARDGPRGAGDGYGGPRGGYDDRGYHGGGGGGGGGYERGGGYDRGDYGPRGGGAPPRGYDAPRGGYDDWGGGPRGGGGYGGAGPRDRSRERGYGGGPGGGYGGGRYEGGGGRY